MWHEVVRELMSSATSRGSRWTLYYDGGCGFCSGARSWLSKLDFLHRIEWTPYHTLDEPPDGLTWEDLGRYACMDTGRGPLHKGFYAMRLLTLRLLPLFPLAPLMWLPGVNRAGEAVYGWVARNRYRLSGCPVDGGRRV